MQYYLLLPRQENFLRGKLKLTGFVSLETLFLAQEGEYIVMGRLFQWMNSGGRKRAAGIGLNP